MPPGAERREEADEAGSRNSQKKVYVNWEYNLIRELPLPHFKGAHLLPAPFPLSDNTPQKWHLAKLNIQGRDPW